MSVEYFQSSRVAEFQLQLLVIDHVIANCEKLKKKQQSHSGSSERHSEAVHRSFTPGETRRVRMLRDSAGSQSVILRSVLPFSNRSACGSVRLRGVELGQTHRPLHRGRIESHLVSGVFPVAVCPALPVSGIALLLGNDVARRRVVLRVIPDTASRVRHRPDDAEAPEALPSRAAKHTQRRKSAANKKARASVNLTDLPLSELSAGGVVATATSESPAFNIVAKAARPTHHQSRPTCQAVDKPHQCGGRWSRDVDAVRLRWCGPSRQDIFPT